jgi:hypothetical protein
LDYARFAVQFSREIKIGMARKFRVPVGAVGIDGQTIGSQVTLLKNMEAAARVFGLGDSQVMKRARFAEEDDIGHVMDLDNLPKIGRPLIVASMIVDASRSRPKQPVAWTKVDAQTAMPARFQLIGQSGEKWRSDSLEEQIYELLVHVDIQ